MVIKIYIGTEEAQWLPTEVLKYSARKRTKADLEFHELKNIPLKLNLKTYTGFSFYRFSIPEACQYAGRALYLDADIVVLSDLEELVNHDMAGKGVLARPNPPIRWYTSVMMMDCEKLKHWKIHDWVTMVNAKVASYQGTLWGEPSGLSYRDFGPLEEYWNHLDQFDQTTKIIHYTNVPKQPWKSSGNANAHVFLRELNQALLDKAIDRAAVEAEIKSGHIYPEILKDMEKVSAA